MPEMPDNREGYEGEASLADQTMNILGSLHAAMVNFHLYPPTSDIVEDSVKRALEDLKQALRNSESITFCETEGKLVINEYSMDEKEQSRPNTLAFLKDLAVWEVRSISFKQGLGDEELRNFLEVFSRKRSDRTLGGSLSELLGESGIEHVVVDEKIYVSLSKDQDIATATVGVSSTQAMDMLKDEVFVRYLVGNAPGEEASPEEVSELMSNPERINSAFHSVMLGFEGSGGSMGTEKASVIRDTVDRMYGLVERMADSELKDILSEEMVNILAALEPETLVEVLTEQAPRAVKDPQMRREIISSVEGDNVLRLTDQIIEKYLGLLTDRANMDPQVYDDISSVLNEIVADLYLEGEPVYHPEITRRLRESGLLADLARSHPQAGKDMELYTIITDIRSSGSLRTLEGLSDDDVVMVAGKLLDMGEKGMAQKIIAVTSHNLESERPDFRMRACHFLKEAYRDFKERGHSAEILDKDYELVAILEREVNPEVREGLLELLGYIANDLFVAGRLREFERVVEALLAVAEQADESRTKRAAGAALSSLDPWDVGKPLADSLYGEDEKLRELAARILPYLVESVTANEIVTRLKDEEEVNITPQLARVCGVIGDPMLSAVSELMEGNVREEVLIRALILLELMDGPKGLSMIKSAASNPVPMVRAQAYRSMSRVSPGDPALLPHFLQAMNDDDVDVRREGVRGLGTIDDPRTVDSLLVIVNGKSLSGGEENPRVQEIACLALARLGPEKALPPLSDLLRKKSFTLRRRTVHPRVKAAACYALGRIGGSEVVDLLKGYLDDPDPVVRNEARKAVSEMRKRGLVE